MHRINRFGWKPDLPDIRDAEFKAPLWLVKALPPVFDLRDKMPAVFDQGNLGSCTANSLCGLVWYTALRQGQTSITAPSRLFEYYNTRAIEGSINYDSGASIRDSIKAAVKCGVCPETDWSYNIAKFKIRPPKQAYDDAKLKLVTKYHSVQQNAGQLKGALSQGLPVDFGFTVYESFESDRTARTGIVSLPKSKESVLGGHAVLLVGYDDTKSWYICRNSWGKDWGDKGYFYLPYKYVENQNLASDFWVINAVM